MKTGLFSRLAIAGVALASVLSPAQSPTPATQTSDQQSAAEAKVRVHGMVRTAKGLPVPGATIRVVHLPSGQAWMSATDENGKFSIHGLPPGRYRIEARHLGLGMSTQESTFLGSSGEAIQVTLSNTATPPASSPTGAQNTPSSPVQTAAKADANKVPKVTANAGGHKKQDVFAQVEPSGQPSASAELGNASSSNPDGGGSMAKVPVADAFLINGTVGRGANAQSGGGFDDNASDDASADDKADGKHKKKTRARGRSHQVEGKSAAANSSTGFLPQQDVEDLVLGQRLKHLGSNRVRLTLYDQYGNSALNAEPFALTDPDPRRVAYYKERGGVSLGGPFVLPHIYNGRDRTFFFVNYEIDRHRDPLDLIETVPLPAERQGDFAARGLQLFNPLSNLAGPRTPMGSVIPAELLNPTALALLNLVPLPNLRGLVQNYHRQAALAQAMDRVNVRMLHTFSPDLNVQAIYNLVEFTGQNGTPYPTLSSQQSARAQNFTLGLSQNWSPHLLNDTRFNFSRIRTQNLNGFAFSEDLAQQLGVSGVSTNPIDFGAPTIHLTNYTGISDANPLLDRRQTFRFTDNLAYTMTKHTLRAGGEVRYRYINTFSNPTPRGDFTFAGLMTSQLTTKGVPVKGTGYDLADFLLGLPQTTSLQYGVLRDYLRDRWYVAYVQDDWRIYPRFSVNYGVRYEYVTPLFEKYNHMVNLLMNPSMTAVSMVIPGATTPFGGNPLPDSLIRPDKNNWAPRLGIAWRPFNSGPVMRAGYGIFYNGSIYEQLAATMLNQPPFALAQTSVTSPNRLLTLSNGFPGQGSKVVANTAAVDPNYHVGYAQIWNLTIETPISPTFTVEATYTGTRGTHLDLILAPNQATPGSVIGADLRRRIPGAPDFRYETSGADSLYNGLQIRVQRRESNGFRFLTLYTFSKSLDDASAIGVGSRQGVVQDINNIRAEWGLSSFDVRHMLRNWLSYELPFGDRKPWLHSGAGAALLGNWRISTITQISSGLHYTPLLSGASVNGTGALYSQRPDMVGNPVLGQPSAFLFFNTAAFALPAAGQFGDAPRGSIVGPGFINVNASLGRTFHFGAEGKDRMELRWEVQNVLNMVNYSGLSTVLGSADFGRVKGARPMRSMDVLMRVHL